jgi:hypothetical protein
MHLHGRLKKTMKRPSQDKWPSFKIHTGDFLNTEQDFQPLQCSKMDYDFIVHSPAMVTHTFRTN